jgi:hypothetical protein
MKKHYVLFFTVFVILLSCNAPVNYEDDHAGLALRGEHRLRKVTESSKSDGSMNGSFFIFSGSIGGEEHAGPAVSFAWQTDDSTYILSTLPYDKIRIRFNEKVDTPTIKFRWRSMNSTDLIKEDMVTIMKHYVIYAMISVKKKDWPVQIHLPMNNTDTTK